MRQFHHILQPVACTTVLFNHLGIGGFVGEGEYGILLNGPALTEAVAFLLVAVFTFPYLAIVFRALAAAEEVDFPAIPNPILMVA